MPFFSTAQTEPHHGHLLPPEIFQKIVWLTRNENSKREKWFSSLRLVSKAWDPFIERELMKIGTFYIGSDWRPIRFGKYLTCIIENLQGGNSSAGGVIEDGERIEVLDLVRVIYFTRMVNHWTMPYDSYFNFASHLPNLTTLHLIMNPLCSPGYQIPVYPNLVKLNLEPPPNNTLRRQDTSAFKKENWKRLFEGGTLMELSLSRVVISDDWISEADQVESYRPLRSVSLRYCTLSPAAFETLFHPSRETLQVLIWIQNGITHGRPFEVGKLLSPFRDLLKGLSLDAELEWENLVEDSERSNGHHHPSFLPKGVLSMKNLVSLDLTCTCATLNSLATASAEGDSETTSGSSPYMFPSLTNVILQLIEFTPGSLASECPALLPWMGWMGVRSLDICRTRIDLDDFALLLNCVKDIRRLGLIRIQFIVPGIDDFDERYNHRREDIFEALCNVLLLDISEVELHDPLILNELYFGNLIALSWCHNNSVDWKRFLKMCCPTTDENSPAGGPISVLRFYNGNVIGGSNIFETALEVLERNEDYFFDSRISTPSFDSTNENDSDEDELSSEHKTALTHLFIEPWNRSKTGSDYYYRSYTLDPIQSEEYDVVREWCGTRGVEFSMVEEEWEAWEAEWIKGEEHREGGVEKESRQEWDGREFRNRRKGIVRGAQFE